MDITIGIAPETPPNAKVPATITISTYEVDGEENGVMVQKTKVSFSLSVEKVIKDEATGRVTRCGIFTHHFNGDIDDLAPEFAQYAGAVEATKQYLFGVCAAIINLGMDK